MERVSDVWYRAVEGGAKSHEVNVRLKNGWLIAMLMLALMAMAQEDKNPTRVRSSISIFDIATHNVRVVYSADKLWEAPNWSPDGKYLLANSGGAIYRIAVDGKSAPEPIALDASYTCNNDHGISSDGNRLAFSATHGDSRDSQVFVSAIDGTNPKLVTDKAPSYFHGWSPDGRWLAYVGERGGHFNIFRVNAAGGAEERLTSAAAYDDGPDYSTDGKWIYINSDRSGGWDIWRFPADGAGQGDAKAERVTSDSMEDWFPHPSPDGKWLVFLSFPHGTEGHDVKTTGQLRMMAMPTSATPESKPNIRVVTEFFGGQGTINVNSWSPDSHQFAFVSYEVLK
jgi:Tol biopolymer transport system component